MDTQAVRSRTLRGLAWKGASQVVLQVTRIAVLVLLARLLEPRDYGLAAMVLVFASFVLVFSDLALGAALVQRRSLDEHDRATVFWTGAGAGVCFTLVGVALSWPLASFYGEPDVQPLFAALSLTFLLTALGATQTALLTREMDFRSLELRQMAATLAAAAVAISIAVAGGGAWAIIGQQLTLAAVATVLVWRFVSWRPSWRFSLESLRSLGSFSASIFAQRLLYYSGRNVDNLLIGRFLGPAALGAYALAYNVMLMPFHQIAGPIQQVMFPAFARLQDERERMAHVWIRVTRMVAAVAAPALLCLIVVAPEFVDVVLGQQWDDATPVIRILAWVGLLQSLMTVNGDVLMALGRATTYLKFTAVWFVVNLAAFVVGLQWGIVGVAACYAVSSSFLEPMNAALTARALGRPLREWAAGLAGVFQAAVLTAVIVWLVQAALIAQDVGPTARLAILVVVGIAAYVVLARLRAAVVFEEIRAIRRGRAAQAATS